MSSSRKILFLIDSKVSHDWSFVQSLEEGLGESVEIRSLKATRDVGKIKRALGYVWLPLVVFFSRRRYRSVISWQQFYGIFYAFFCRLFGVKKANRVFILMFIYKPKGGMIGRVYKWFMKYAVSSRYIDKLVVYSRHEADFYAREFGVDASLFEFVPLCINPPKQMAVDSSLVARKYICAAGSSHRDYDFLIDVIKGADYNLDIISDRCSLPVDGEKVRIHGNCFGDDYLKLLANCYCVVIPLKDKNISAGQMCVLQAMAYGKPVIITDSYGIRDYVSPDVNGILIPNSKDNLLGALNRLYTDSDLYSRLSSNALNLFSSNFSISSMGSRIASICKD